MNDSRNVQRPQPSRSGTRRLAGRLVLASTFIVSAPAWNHGGGAGLAAQQVTITPDLQVEPLADGVWLHTTWKVLDGGPRIQSNGLIVRDGNELVLIDTAWGVEETRALLAWIDEEIGLPIRTALATHFHDDRLGGGAVLAERGLSMMAHPMTVTLAAAEGNTPAPTAIAGLASGRKVSFGGVEVFYPGGGHTWTTSSRGSERVASCSADA